MTHPIHPNTINFNVNLARGERRIVEAASFELGMSAGAFYRKYFLEGLKTLQPALATAVEAARRHHREIKAAALALIFFAALALDTDMVRTARRVRGRRDEVEVCA